MKHFLLGVILFIYSFGVGLPTNAQTTGPSLSTTITGTTIAVTLSGIPVQVHPSQFKYVIDTKEVTSVPTWIDQPAILFGTQELSNAWKTPVNEAVSWNITGLKANTAYHIRIVEFPPTPASKKFATPDTLVTTGNSGEIFFNEAVFKKLDSTLFTLSGSIILTKHKETDPIPNSTITVSAAFYTKPTKEAPVPELILQLTPTKTNDKGEYLFQINNKFNGNTDYDLKVSFDSSVGAHSEHTYTVNTGKGYIIPETGKEADDFVNKRSYRLLAPIPGMTLLLDPERCKLKQEEAAAAGRKAGEICDINAFLNFLLSLAIGAAAVVLVLRIIIDGFGYMTTDIPFRKAKLKGSFIDALIGLVVALSSYLILNTINPRLVANDVSIGIAEFDVEEVEDINYSNADYTTISKDYGVTNPNCPQPLGSITGEGLLNKPKIINKVCPAIESGALTNIKGITIHGTAGNNPSDSILKGWITNNLLWDKGTRSITVGGRKVAIQPSSAHFIVDKDGTISQTVRLNKGSTHCGKCQKTGSTNTTSISIEVVMACIKDCTSHTSKAVWETPTSNQVTSTALLVNYLLEKYPYLKKDQDIYVHGEQASNRTYNEGRNTLDAIKPYLK